MFYKLSIFFIFLNLIFKKVILYFLNFIQRYTQLKNYKIILFLNYKYIKNNIKKFKIVFRFILNIFYIIHLFFVYFLSYTFYIIIILYLLINLNFFIDLNFYLKLCYNFVLVIIIFYFSNLIFTQISLTRLLFFNNKILVISYLQNIRYNIKNIKNNL
jgi:hypothetical protein